ncbi:MAG: MarR family winged helix-turn-helix transcriptional regulator [Micrococcales bacterium]
MTAETREPQKHTGFLLRRAQQKHISLWLQLVGSDTTNVQYGILSVLERNPGASQKEICEELDLDRSTIADVCSRLEKNDLVSRTPADDDRRRNVLLLTKAGQKELQRMRPLVNKVQLRLADKLTAAEHEQLRELLRKLLAD